METLRDRMEADLKIGGYSPSTRKIYLLYARLFAKGVSRNNWRMSRNAADIDVCGLQDDAAEV